MAEMPPIQMRDRVRELRRVRAGDLVPNPKNWRIHTDAQRAALTGLLREVGYADALLVRELPDGRLGLIDGELRATTTPDQVVPVLLLDVTEAEADKLLATLDPLASLAQTDAAMYHALVAGIDTDAIAVRELLDRVTVVEDAPAGEPTEFLVPTPQRHVWLLIGAPVAEADRLLALAETARTFAPIVEMATVEDEASRTRGAGAPRA